MAGVINRIKQFIRSPQGQRAIHQARQASADPKKRAQAKRMLGKFRGRR
ncbi:hypothetical protein GCM10009837_62020 [Streptomyces durmitorensis]|uniref:Uncharacterized protein n=1 Tax=Streptomyces durmitorensis TaxID=319947 RepID=A0ABY4Q4H4_9ACTN|nr:hypothetical protein [Streptomyces durmitorensis]UQT60072.1 hypothetical protein M4V62_36245 [Streptomyces durmitorensis]